MNKSLILKNLLFSISLAGLLLLSSCGAGKEADKTNEPKAESIDKPEADSLTTPQTDEPAEQDSNMNKPLKESQTQPNPEEQPKSGTVERSSNNPAANAPAGQVSDSMKVISHGSDDQHKLDSIKAAKNKGKFK